jgi:hypothetical protein
MHDSEGIIDLTANVPLRANLLAPVHGRPRALST